LTIFLFVGEDFEMFSASFLAVDDAFVGMTVTSLGFASKPEQFENSPSLMTV
jgi:hypothetical protein